MVGDNEPERKVDLTPHRLAPTGGRAAEPEEGLTSICGFVGESATEGEIRVHLDLSFANYYEVKAEDVVRTKAVDADDPDSPRELWIKSEAGVRLVRTDRQSGPLAYLEGAMHARRRGHGQGTAAIPQTDSLAYPYKQDCPNTDPILWSHHAGCNPIEVGGKHPRADNSVLVCPSVYDPGCLEEWRGPNIRNW